MREAEVGGVGDELLGAAPASRARAATSRRAPRRSRSARAAGRSCRRALQPGVVAPLVARAVDPRRRLGRHLGVEGERVGLQAQLRRRRRAPRTCRRRPRRPPGRARPRSPTSPARSSGCARPSQRFQSPTTETPRAFGAQTAKRDPVVGRRARRAARRSARAAPRPRGGGRARRASLFPLQRRQSRHLRSCGELRQDYAHCPSMRRIPATGIATQSGRLCSS